MSKIDLTNYKEKIENLFLLKRAPSQFKVFTFLLESGKIMTVREIAEYLDLTTKATERAISKLVDKGLVLRSTFREASYNVDSNKIFTYFLITLNDLYDDYKKRES